MTVLQNKLAALKGDTSVSPALLAWITEATNRIERSHAAEAALSARLDALETPSPAGPAAPVGPFTLKDGGGTKASSVFDYDPAGHVYEKLHVQNYLYHGIGAMRWPAQEIATPVTVRDCIIENVAAVPPQSRNGTAEACLWIGNRAVVSRVKIRNGAWMGMWTGAACVDSIFEDIDIDDCPHVGLYIEHQTKRCVFRNCRFSAQDNAVNIEWWYNGQGSSGLLFENCEFHSVNGWGLFADAGTYDLALRGCTFTGKYGLSLPKNLAGSPGNTFTNCNFDGVTGGMKTHEHNNAIG